MKASVFQNIIALIERSEKILLCTHRKPDGDAIGSVMALSKALNLLGKEVVTACSDEAPEAFRHFLPSVDQLRQDIPGGRDFVVTLDCNQTEVDRLKYHLEDNKIHIVITPKKGRFFEDNVSCHERVDHYDLIISVDVADVPQLGKLYEENVALFSSVPLVNIDHHISNTEFGKLNLIDVAACSTAEILYGLLREMEKHFQKKLVVPEVATFLLSGVTTDTGSFQNANTTPRSMEIAAELMDEGAQQQDIIKYLFRTKKLTTLKLWGRILTKIEVDDRHRLVWSTITQQDLKLTGAAADDAGEIIDELLVHAPEADIVVLFKEDRDLISVSLRSKTPQANVMEIAQQFGGGGHVQAAGIKFPHRTLSEVMNLVLPAFFELQRQRLGLDTLPSAGPKGPEITQILEGYTTDSAVKPSLEEKVKEVKREEQPDIHDRAKAAIEAEQREGGIGVATPSQKLSQQERPRPQPEKRFTDEVPDFLKPKEKAPETPPEKPLPPTPKPTVEKPLGEEKPALAATAQDEEGITVTYTKDASTPPTPPPTVTPPKAALNPLGDAAPKAPPAAPKDPFSTGDDGLTDIERALSGL